MNDRRAHFLTMLGDACVAAGLAGIPVELILGDGGRVVGTPSPQPAENGNAPANETGYASLLLVDGAAVQLEDVVEFVIHTP
ncbi:MAG TPA: hypothetical protein VGF95_09040 [Solirubrobacteraceae bacterium]